MPTLIINKSDSQCDECGSRQVSPHDIRCKNCDVKWDTVSSMYAGGGIERQIMRLRPDLEPHFPWYDWYNTPEGQQTLDEFRVQLQMDENQD